MTNLLEVHELTKEYGGARPLRAVDKVSFNLGAGEIVGILGPNGAGKTTTIRLLISVLRPTSGTIRFFGKELQSHRSEVLQEVAFASTYTNLPLFLSVAENLDIHGRLYGMSKSDRMARADELLSYFGVRDLRRQRISQLSAGQKTRVMLTKAFLPRPRVALLDEPTASLDPDIAHEVRNFVRRERSERGTAVLFSSHNMQEVADICDRVLFLKAGKVLAIGTPAELAADSSKTLVALGGVEERERALAILGAKGITVREEGSSLLLQVTEQALAPLLIELARAGVNFAELHLSKPTLEDYFLKHSRLTDREGV